MKIDKTVDKYLNEAVGEKAYYNVFDYSPFDADKVTYSNPSDLRKKLQNDFKDMDGDETNAAVKYVLSAVAKGQKVYMSSDPYELDVHDKVVPLYDTDLKDLERQDKLAGDEI